MKLATSTFLFLIIAYFYSFSQTLEVTGLLNDHAVIQRDKPVIIEGISNPYSSVQVVLSGSLHRIQANKDGRWRAVLPSRSAGGPYEIKVVSGEENIQFKDIYFGDVWLAVGEANMAYKMEQGVLDGAHEIKVANYDRIRTFTLSNRMSDQPEEEVQGSDWKVCSPETVGKFSAVSYFFARKFFEETRVPMGIILAAQRGSTIESWMSKESLDGLPHQSGPEIPEVRSGKYSLKGYAKLNEYNARQVAKASVDSYEGISLGVTKPGFNDSSWDIIDLVDWKARSHQVYWFRKAVSIRQFSGDSVKLCLGMPGSKIDVYFNNRHIGVTKNRPFERSIPKNLVAQGKNVIVLRISNPLIKPFLVHDEEMPAVKTLSGETLVDLSRSWKYSNDIEKELPQIHEIQTIPSALFNGMIHSCLNKPMAGVLWYQGEKNGLFAQQYKELFPALISDWRVRAKQGYFPFYFVQLPNFGEPSEETDPNNGWAYLREAQMETLKSPMTGMAVTVDAGDGYSLHPKDKKTVGERLALHALANQMGKKVEVSGPIVNSIEIQGIKVTVKFDHATGIKTNDQKAPRCFSLAGADGVFYKAKARISENDIILFSEHVNHPKYVRYAWSGNPIVNLYNAADLPAVPFRTDRISP